MKSAITVRVLCASAILMAQVALAAAPKVTLDIDEKDSKSVKVTVTSPDDQLTYRCRYAWQVTFKNTAQTNDSCDVDVAPGTKAAALCVKNYDTRVSQVTLMQKSCKPL